MPEIADVVVVGGGILGLALTWELARQNLKVVLLEQRTLGSGTTGTSFSWLNATSKTEDEAYHRLNAQGMAEYEHLAGIWGEEALGLHGGGWLAWSAPEDQKTLERLAKQAARLKLWDYSVQSVDEGELHSLEPQVNFPAGASGLFAPADRWVDARQFVRFVEMQVRACGGKIYQGCPVLGFTSDATGQISAVQTTEGTFATRTAILSAGGRIPALVAQVTGDARDEERFPLKPVPGLLVEVAPNGRPQPIQRLLDPPDAYGLHLRPTPEGGLLIAADDGDEAVTHTLEDSVLYAASVELLRRSKAHLPGWFASNPWSSSVGVRAIPADGLPIVGALPDKHGIYVAVSHSGFTLGLVIAKLLAQQIVSGRTSPLLARYALERFALAIG